MSNFAKGLIILCVCATFVWIGYVARSIVDIPKTPQAVETGYGVGAGKEMESEELSGLGFGVPQVLGEFKEIYQDSNSYAIARIYSKHQVWMFVWRDYPEDPKIVEHATEVFSARSYGDFDSIEKVFLKDGKIFVLSKADYHLILSQAAIIIALLVAVIVFVSVETRRN